MAVAATKIIFCNFTCVAYHHDDYNLFCECLGYMLIINHERWVASHLTHWTPEVKRFRL